MKQVEVRRKFKLVFSCYMGWDGAITKLVSKNLFFLSHLLLAAATVCLKQNKTKTPEVLRDYGIFCFVFVFETGSHTAQGSLQLIM